jgi:hypothetical protein
VPAFLNNQWLKLCQDFLKKQHQSYLTCCDCLFMKDSQDPTL